MEPKIRLKGYSGEWVEKTLGEISTSFSGGTPSAGVAQYYGGNIPFIRSGEINDDHTQLFITEEGLNSSSARMVDKGTLLYALYGATSGEVGISKIHGAINQAILAIYPSKEICTKYLAHYLRAKKEQIIGNLLQGGQGNLSGALVKGVKIHYPSAVEDQEAIGNYLDKIDTLIQSTSKKIEALKRVKSASMQSMFPQESETAPRIRFKGFEGEWIKSVVGDLGTTYSGLSGKTKEDFGKGDAKYITFLNVLTNAKIDTSILEAVKVCEGERQNKVQQGDLLFNTSSETPEEVGMCAVMEKNIDNVYLNSFCFGFRLTDTNTSPLFISYILRSHIGRRLMSLLAQGATRYNLSKTSFCKATILLPSTKEEQQLIADYFANLDYQINLQSQRLEKLKQIKAACLDNMFV